MYRLFCIKILQEVLVQYDKKKTSLEIKMNRKTAEFYSDSKFVQTLFECACSKKENFHIILYLTRNKNKILSPGDFFFCP
jgi:hypothetical protein